jgi:hypothetical protein
MNLLEMASRASLAFLGQEDIALSVDPQVTYFKEKYEGSSLFASRVDKVQFNNDTLVLGGENVIELPRSGDLITEMYLKIFLPLNLRVREVEESVGTLIIDHVELYIGSTLIERIYGEFIAMKYDIEVPQGKQQALTGLIGKGTQVAALSYTVPLPFSLLQKGIPICAFKEPVTFRIITNGTRTFTIPPVDIVEPVPSYLHVEYTYLGQKEVDYIRKTPQIHILEQIQLAEFAAPLGALNVRCNLGFSNIVKELFFVIQNETAMGYDFLADNTSNVQQIQSLEFFFNSTERISSEIGTPLFLRVIQSLEFHTRVPGYYFYMYSFSLDPESRRPSGGVNMSRIQNQILKLNLNPSASARVIRVYATNYNFLQVANGSATILFSNFG